MTTTKQYDHLNRLTQISSQPSASGVPPVAFNYNCNTANQRTKDVLADGSYWIYTYDSLGQVISGHKYFYDNTPVPGQQFDYTFDTIGNRTQTKVGGDQTGGNQRVANYSANNLNQITSRDYPGTNDIIGAALATNSVTVNSQTAFHKGEYFWGTIKTNNTTSPAWLGAIVNSGGISTTGNVYLAQTPEHFSYDADGNLTNDGRWAYTWDAENRLVCMTVNTNVGPQYQLSFVYDSGGRRIQKLVVTNNVAQCTNTFLYNGWNLIAETAPNNSLVRGYVWGNDLSGSLQGAGGVGGLLEVSYYGTSTTNCFAAFNGNGNIAMLANTADGTTIANYEYGPFGEVIRATGPMAKANPIRFSTKYQDDESDMPYYGYRYYKPSTGTWLSRDPKGETGGMNLYAHTDNDGVDFIDALGLWKIYRMYGIRAIAIAECGDTVDGLAYLIHFDGRDYQSWLIPVSGGMPPTEYEGIPSGTVFTIPNTVFVDIGQPVDAADYFPVSGYSVSKRMAVDVGRAEASQGKFVVYTYGATGENIKTHLKSKDLDSYIFGGHGSGDGNIGVDKNGDHDLDPDRFTKYGIAFMGLYACDSAQYPNPGPWKYVPWEDNVATQGEFEGFDGLINGFDFWYVYVVTPGINSDAAP